MWTADRIFLFSVRAKVDSNHYFRDFCLEIFYFQTHGGQTVWCVVGKTTLYRGCRQAEMPNGPA